jgi:hypothetical protein
MKKLEAMVWLIACGLATLPMATKSLAAQIPAALRGKSVLIDWADDRTVKDPSGREKNLSQTAAIKLYVSENGRVFSQMNRSTGSKDQKTDVQVSGASNNFLNWHFDDGTLIADQHFLKGARRLIVKFADGFENCALTVLHGKETGTGAIRYLGMNDQIEYEIMAISVTSTSCRVQTGNVFAAPQ